MSLSSRLLREIPGYSSLYNGVFYPIKEGAKWLLPSYRRWHKAYGNLLTQLPHIRDYEGAKPSLWLPFVMDAMEPNLSSTAMNSDPLGFRYSIDGSGQRLSPYTPLDSPVSLFIGGSTALGVGATTDATTIPSLLSQKRQEPWFNLGMRGCTIAQNLIQFMIFRPQIGRVKQLVLFAGWNEVNGFIMSPLFTRYYGAFHGFSKYFEAMNGEKVEISRKTISYPENWSSLISFSLDKEATRAQFLEHMRNILDNWKFIANGLVAELIFVLQPASFCVPHELTTEEQSWFENKSNLATLRRAAKSFEGWFAEALLAECQRLGIPFLDSNKIFGRDLNESLFIDPLHLTDQGNREIVKIVDNVLGSVEK